MAGAISRRTSCRAGAIYSAGLGLAAGYIEDHLREWNVKPGRRRRDYLQTVRVLGVKATSRSTVTVQVGGETRTFKDGEGVTLPANPGRQAATSSPRRVEFAGYGLDAPAADHMDFRGKDVKGAAVVWLGATGPKASTRSTYRQLLTGRSRYATDQLARSRASAPRRSASSAASDRDKARRRLQRRSGRNRERGRGLHHGAAPRSAGRASVIGASDAFFEFLFSSAPVGYDELKRKADAQEPLPSFRLDDVRLTFNIDVDYAVVRTQLTQNVVGIVEGSDPQLKNSLRRRSARTTTTSATPKRSRAGDGVRARRARARDAGRRRRSDLERRRRRRLGHRGADGAGAGVRGRAAAEALAALRLACGRGARAATARATSPTIRPCRSTRSSRS